ncbi:hypothetical protein MACH17_43350 [Phaeobacter inhibens]|nr:hypothetical protein MACH17_43350 [Phaeobacter inhibens]
MLDDLGRQIGMIRLSSREAQLAHGLLHSLDERGFLTADYEEMANYLGSSVAEITRLVPTLQKHVEPAGLFATSLTQCFQLQLEAKNRFDPLIEKLLGRLDLIARRNIAEICTVCGVDEEDAIEMLEDIRSLDPAPLLEKPEVAQTLGAPEIIIRVSAEDTLLVHLNEDALPEILTDDGLFSATLKTETDGYAQSYYRDCYRGAANMVRAMQKRANTLLATGNAIAKRQEKFIKSGRDRHKRPLTIEQLASEVGVNKSTISRALKSCNIMTDKGIFSAQQFLARGLTPDQQGEKTRDQALRRLSLLIKTENQNQPSSDEQLKQQLETAGFKLSRRTVAKYRKMLAIPGAHARKLP